MSLTVEQTALNFLDNLTEIIDDGFPHWDAQLSQTALRIIMDDRREYLIHYQRPLAQLWLSSPVSGAHHFTLTVKGWQSTRGEDMIEDILTREIPNLAQFYNA